MGVTEYNKEVYSKIFEEKKDDYYFDFFKEKNEMMISLIDNEPKKILDLGCGDGWFGEKLKKKFNAEVHGIDIAPNAIKLAKKRGLITKELNLDGRRLPYGDNTFDVVVAADLIEHLFDTEKIVGEVYRVLRKGGIFLVSTPNINSYQNRFLIPFGKMPAWIETAPNLIFIPFKNHFKGEGFNPGHIRVFNRDSLSGLLEHFGFKVEGIKGIALDYSDVKRHLSPVSRRLIGLLQVVERLFSKSPRTASIIIAKATKN